MKIKKLTKQKMKLMIVGDNASMRRLIKSIVVSKDRTDYIVTNDLTQNQADETQMVCAIRWKIKQLHREAKQLTGLESCQCRKARIQRNHIACALLVWCRFKELMYQTKRTVYQIKFGQLSDYLIQQLKSPSVKMRLA